MTKRLSAVPSYRFARNADAERNATARYDELLVRLPSGGTWTISSTGKAIWDLCDGTRDCDAIAGQLASRHFGDAAIIRRDVKEFLMELVGTGLLHRLPAQDDGPAALSGRGLARPSFDYADLRQILGEFDRRHPGVRVANAMNWADDGASFLTAKHCYRKLSIGVENGPLDHPNIEAALQLLQKWPLGAEQVKRTIIALHPVIDPKLGTGVDALLARSYCHSSEAPDMFGCIWSSINCPIMLAENIVHELGHQKLFAIGIYKESAGGFVTNPKDLAYSPFMECPRPITAVLHGVYAYAHVTELDRCLLAAEPNPRLVGRLKRRLQSNQKRLQDGIAQVSEFGRFDAMGHAFWNELVEWCEELCEHQLTARPLEPASALRSSHAARARVSREPIRVFVGSDLQQRRAELALEHSIRESCSMEYEITWMRRETSAVWRNWHKVAAGSAGQTLPWPTDFSCFRFTIPEAANFEGRAIYLDVDMIVRADLSELFTMDMAAPWMATVPCSAAMLINCEFFANSEWWPSIDEMKKRSWPINKYLRLLRQHEAFAELDGRWNCRDDQAVALDEDCKIVHYTTRSTQPWRPHPERMEYRPHPSIELEELWWTTYARACGAAAATSEQARRRRRGQAPSLGKAE